MHVCAAHSRHDYDALLRLQSRPTQRTCSMLIRTAVDGAKHQRTLVWLSHNDVALELWNRLQMHYGHAAALASKTNTLIPYCEAISLALGNKAIVLACQSCVCSFRDASVARQSNDEIRNNIFIASRSSFLYAPPKSHNDKFCTFILTASVSPCPVSSQPLDVECHSPYGNSCLIELMESLSSGKLCILFHSMQRCFFSFADL